MTVASDIGYMKGKLNDGPQLDKDIIDKWVESLPLWLLITDENLAILRSRVDIGCPICRTKLVFVIRGHYETLSEHVCPTNETPSFKDAYGCPNKECEANKDNIKWLADGEGAYGGDYSKKYNYIDGNCAPFRTWSRQYNSEKNVRHRIIENRWFMLDTNVSTKANMDGVKNHLLKKFTFDLWIKKRSGYEHYISGLHMLIYSLKMYSRNIDRIYEFTQHIKTEDARWWAKLSLFIAKRIWRKDYEKAVKEIR